MSDLSPSPLPQTLPQTPPERSALARWWFPATPALRLATLRVLIAGFGLVWMAVLSPILYANAGFPAARFEGVGIAAGLASPPAGALVALVWAATMATGVLTLLGARFRVSAPAFALGMLALTTYRNSWGMVFHTENLLVVHALILALLPAADAWSLDARRRPEHPPTQPSPAYGWGPKLMAAVTTLAYLIAGVAKLRNSGGAWLSGDTLLAQVAWDNLRKVELGDMHSPLGALLSGYPWIFAPLAWMSMALELGAPLALLHRQIAKWWALGMWSFHLGVFAIMWIMFPYPLSGVAFAPLLAVDEAVSKLAARQRRRHPDHWTTRLLPREDRR